MHAHRSLPKLSNPATKIAAALMTDDTMAFLNLIREREGADAQRPHRGRAAVLNPST
jgi:hypothetical protein